MKPTETPAQFTARLREKYKDVLGRLELGGLNKDQQLIDKFLCGITDLKPFENTKEQQILKEINLQINSFIKQLESK